VTIQTTTATTSATLPRVNLLPPEIQERKRLQQVQAAVLVGVVAVAGGVGYLYYEGTHNVSDARQQVAQANSQNAQLTRQLATFSDVKATAAQLNASEALLTQAASTEIRWSEYLADFGFLPKNSWMTSVSINSALAAGTLTTPSQAAPVVGSLTISGVSTKYPDLATWLDSLAEQQNAKQQKMLENVYLSKAEETFIGATKVVKFSASADVPAAGLSDRCATPGSC
jgi:Tfp pilus assembly protein PilN